MLPGSVGFLPDEIAGLSPEVWSPFPFDGRHPPDVTRDFLAYCEPLVAGPLIVVPDDCWRPEIGPFEITDALRAFATSYPDRYECPFISGDTFVLSPSTSTVVAVHHNGLTARLSVD
jgi:hypothetical protein